MSDNSQKLPSVKDTNDLKGKAVLLRASLNVPIESGQVVNQFRIMRTLPTINWLRQVGARTVVIGHIGRDPKETLEPVYNVLNTLFETKWCDEVVGQKVTTAVSDLKDGEVILLENLRRNPGEKGNNENFAKELAELADVYINDAFDAAHRAHASLVGVPKFLPSYFGLNFLTEYQELTKAINPAKPSLFIIGGAKFETKLPLIEKYAKTYSQVMIGGALANDMFKAKGYEVGKSLVSDIDLNDTTVMDHANIILPVDVTVKGDDGVRVTSPDSVLKHEAILDIGPQTVAMVRQETAKASSILWNGPMGNYESGYNSGTEGVAVAVAEASAHTIIGGGDTVAAIESLGIQDKFDFISIAGGAMLIYLESGTLPAIDVVIKAN